MQPTPGSQLALFATYSYHGFSTDRDGETLELEADRRRHAEIENAIRDLKYGVGLNHLPSGRFAANGAWLAVQAMAHNLARWTARIDLGEQIVTTTCYPSYPSLEQFYDWRGGRHSGEADYGWFNWDDAITPDPGESQAHQGRLRVVLVHDTGDLYAVDNIGQGPVNCYWVLSNNIGPGSRWSSAWLTGLRATARAVPSPGSVNASPA